jgi:hypothetical protein
VVTHSIAEAVKLLDSGSGAIAGCRLRDAAPARRIVDATSTVDHSPEPKRLVVTDDAYLP